MSLRLGLRKGAGGVPLRPRSRDGPNSNRLSANRIAPGQPPAPPIRLSIGLRRFWDMWPGVTSLRKAPVQRHGQRKLDWQRVGADRRSIGIHCPVIVSWEHVRRRGLPAGRHGWTTSRRCCSANRRRFCANRCPWATAPPPPAKRGVRSALSCGRGLLEVLGSGAPSPLCSVRHDHRVIQEEPSALQHSRQKWRHNR